MNQWVKQDKHIVLSRYLNSFFATEDIFEFFYLLYLVLIWIQEEATGMTACDA